jgi:membrane associated rhomboid family serine protease
VSVFVNVPSRRRPSRRWVTPVIVALSMAGFMWLATLEPAMRAEMLLRWGTVPMALFSPAQLNEVLLDGRGFSLLSSLFLHANWVHLLGQPNAAWDRPGSWCCSSCAAWHRTSPQPGRWTEPRP